MAPPKKQNKPPPDQVISQKERKKIHDNIPTLATDESAWTRHLNGLAPEKRKDARRVFQEEKSNWDQNSANVTATIGSQGAGTQATDPRASGTQAASTQVTGTQAVVTQAADTGAASTQATKFQQGDAQSHMAAIPPTTRSITATSKDDIAPSHRPITSKALNPDTTAVTSGDKRDESSVDVQSVSIVEENVLLSMPVGNKTEPPSNQMQLLTGLDSSGVHTSYPIRTKLRNATSEVLTNYFEVQIEPGTELYEYQIIGIPETATRRQRKPIIKTMLQSVSFLRNNEGFIATDYHDIIISWKDLSAEIPYKQMDAGDSITREGRTWDMLKINDDHDSLHLCLRFRRRVDYQTLQQYVASQPTLHAWNFSPTCDALNILISKCFHGDVIRLGANKFFVERTQQGLGAGASLCTIRGYSYSIRPKMGKILLNVNAATSAFYQPILVSEYLRDTTTFNNTDRLRFLKGVRVYINYERGARDEESRNSGCNRPQARVKKVFEVGTLAADSLRFNETFDNPDGSIGTRQPTVQQYLQNRYQINLAYPRLPLINLGGKYDQSWFAPELLRILPYQVFRNVVPDNLMADMHNVACRAPETNRLLIENEGLGKLLRNDQHPATLMQCPVLRIEPHMLQVPCHRLPNPTALYSGAQGKQADLNSGRWDLRNVKFLRNQAGRTFNYVFLASENLKHREQTLTNYNTEFNKQIRNCGVGIPVASPHIPLHNLGDGDIENALRVASELKPRPNTVILLLPAKNIPVYSTFKYYADRVYGLQSICMTEEKGLMPKHPSDRGPPRYKPLPQYMGNIAMKANLKVAGVNHASQLLQNAAAKTLVLGADVTHPSPGALPGAPSIAALVGSIDDTGGKFLGELSLQKKERNEMIEDLRDMVFRRLKDWSQVRGMVPDNVLYYRDGVADTQYANVQELELEKIRDAWKDFIEWRIEVDPGFAKLTRPQLQLVAVVVTKRHHTRFYPFKSADKMPGNENCRPGTLVDSCVTSPYFKDFFLQSHNGLLGTAKPAHYFVLENGANWTDEQIQNITHHFCHAYVRATLGVSYAAPAYYADRLCERGRAYLRQIYAPSPDDRNRFNRKRDEYENQARKKRGVQPKTRTHGANQTKKTKAERDAEKKEKAAEKNDRDQAEERTKGEVKDWIRRIWGADTIDETAKMGRNQLLRTMYWM